MADILREFRGIKKRLRTLQQMLLPVHPPGIRGYTIREQDLIATYVLLVHAEIEGFIEFCALEAAEKILTAWASNIKLRALCSLILFHHCRSEKLGDFEINDRSVGRAVNFYQSTVATNHGVKAKNIYTMFLPLGFVHTDFDEVWLATMNSFGRRRGDNAHNWVQARQTIDHVSVSNDINSIIVPELRMIAIRISRLR